MAAGALVASLDAVKLSADQFQELDKRIRKLPTLGCELPDRVLSYLLDGQDDSVLGDLATIESAPTWLDLMCSREHNPHHKHWRDFLATLDSVDPGFLLRLGKVFEAAAHKVPANHFIGQAWFAGALWLEILLHEATGRQARAWAGQGMKISGRMVVEMLRADGRDPTVILTAPFGSPRHSHDYEFSWMRDLMLDLAALGETLAEHRDLIAPFITTGSAESRLRAVENLTRSKAPPATFASELVQAATDTSKLLREASEALLLKIPEAAQPLLEQIAHEGNRTQREHAVRLLGRICREPARAFLESLRETEKSEPVRQAIDAAVGEVAAVAAQADAPLEPPPRKPITLKASLTPALRTILEQMFAEYNEFANRHNLAVANKQANQHVYPHHPVQQVDARKVAEVCRLLEEGGAVAGVLSKSLAALNFAAGNTKGSYAALLQHTDCQLVHVVRLLAMLNYIHSGREYNIGLEYAAMHSLETFRASHTPPITLLDLAEALESLSLGDDILMDALLQGYLNAFDWEAEAVWPFFSTQLERLLKALEPSTGDYFSRWRHEAARKTAFHVLAKFPRVPPAATGRLWDLAIGTNKDDRARAQAVCDKLPDVLERLCTALTSGNFQTRMVAAEWLGRLGNKGAIEPLSAAARKEKQDAALDEMLTALERLGQSIEPFLQRDKLQADALKALKKGIPKQLDWFPWETLPQVHWQDTGEEIPRETLTWLIVQSYKLKSAEAGPLLRRYGALMQPREREELGNFVLQAWLGQDLKRKHSDAEARALARQQAPQTWQSFQGMLQWYQQQNQTPPASLATTQQQVEEQIYQNLQRECGSAVGEKGVLAVAGACCGSAAVGPVQRYLKDWYGYRAAQCKALIAMLSAVDQPLAIQYLLSISNRFRTKGIREEAEKYVNLLAERKGWTLDELADRTMPTAGFDDEGKLELDFGPRKFLARVNAELEVVLYDSDGKALKKLPDPRKDDDAELSAAAKKTFSAAKAELKKFAGLQVTRLYEAMCTERTWPAADWRMYLLEHPLLRFVCQRLVWAVFAEGQLAVTFRPLDDGTLTDYEDNAVQLPEAAQVRIAHSCYVPSAVCEAWTRHLADYEIAPLFTQFGRQPYLLPEERRRSSELDDFQGHMVEAFKLRGLATKLGYTRGQAEDGGWFYEYLKMFPGLGLEVHLAFSGNGLPEENRTVALTTLSFHKARAGQEASFIWRQGSLALKDIPPVLISECMNDLRAIAATGSGFDPQWEKRVHY
jgi:HEAT repeat protein